MIDANGVVIAARVVPAVRVHHVGGMVVHLAGKGNVHRGQRTQEVLDRKAVVAVIVVAVIVVAVIVVEVTVVEKARAVVMIGTDLAKMLAQQHRCQKSR